MRVAYLDSATSDLSLWEAMDGFDEANAGVELVTSDGQTFSAVWQTAGYDEGLSFGTGLAEVRQQRYALRRSDVSKLNEWRTRLNRRVTRTLIGWHRPGNSSHDAVCAVRLWLDSSQAITIVLGKAAGTRDVGYLPDEVAVIFDDAVAARYWSAVVLMPSWPDV